MIITKNTAVVINYRLSDQHGKQIDESNDGSFNYLHGHENIIPGLESALEGKQAGNSFRVTIAPEDGYGLRDESRVEQVPKEMFPSDEEIKAGMEFHAEGANNELITITILEVNEDSIKIDGNDPLAGVTLTFDVDVVSVRKADKTEISHGHIHTEKSCEHEH
jgi:FKBP-type peptidyl-prolyl cis-trans isomerase SlyD